MGLSNTLYSPIPLAWMGLLDRKSTRLNSSHLGSSYAVFCLKKKNPELSAYAECQVRRAAGEQNHQVEVLEPAAVTAPQPQHRGHARRLFVPPVPRALKGDDH